jgi:hypothetical protein
LSFTAGLWQIYELPNPNIGPCSLTEIAISTSAPEMVLAMRVEPLRVCPRRNYGATHVTNDYASPQTDWITMSHIKGPRYRHSPKGRKGDCLDAAAQSVRQVAGYSMRYQRKQIG